MTTPPTVVLTATLATLAGFGISYASVWIASLAARRNSLAPFWPPSWLELLTGLVTNFLDTVGIGSFATTTSVFKLTRMVADRVIPGTRFRPSVECP